MSLKIKTEKVIDFRDWNSLVEKTYCRTYNFQQQEGCRQRGAWRFAVPSEEFEDFTNATVPEEVNHEERGVSFAAWLARDPKQKLSNPDEQEDYCLELWWKRNFYPEFQMVANDLHAKGLLPAGDYMIDIDW